MIAGKDIAVVGTLVGDNARATMLAALFGGQTLTARELAHRAGVTAQTASAHLGKLAKAGMLSVTAEGRHRFYRLASPEVKALIVALAKIAPVKRNWRSYRKSRDVTFARTCYDHMAGRVGVAITDAMRARQFIRPAGDDFLITAAGEQFFAALGIDLRDIKKSRRHLARQCLDWTERRPHLGGSLGAAVLECFLARGWIRCRKDVRAVEVTASGRRELRELLAVDVGALEETPAIEKE